MKRSKHYTLFLSAKTGYNGRKVSKDGIKSYSSRVQIESTSLEKLIIILNKRLVSSYKRPWDFAQILSSDGIEIKEVLFLRMSN